MHATKKRAIMRSIEGITSNRLTVALVACHQFDLSPIEFHDGD